MAAGTTDRLTPMELTVIRRRSDRYLARAEAPTVEAPEVRAAIVSAHDVPRLLAEIVALRKHVADLRAGSLHRLVALVPSGDLRNRLADVVAEVERELSKPSNEEVSSGR